MCLQDELAALEQAKRLNDELKNLMLMQDQGGSIPSKDLEGLTSTYSNIRYESHVLDS